MNAGIVFLAMMIGGVVSAVIAAKKNRSAAAWALCGALFGLISMIILLALEPLPDRTDYAGLNLMGGPR
jgi:urea transporter